MSLRKPSSCRALLFAARRPPASAPLLCGSALRSCPYTGFNSLCPAGAPAARSYTVQRRTPTCTWVDLADLVGVDATADLQPTGTASELQFTTTALPAGLYRFRLWGSMSYRVNSVADVAVDSTPATSTDALGVGKPGARRGGRTPARARARRGTCAVLLPSRPAA